MSKLFPACHIAITVAEVLADRDTFFTLAVRLCTHGDYFKGTTRTEEKEITNAGQHGENFPSEAGRGCYKAALGVILW